jgi:(4-(4-[2-(gamma-L-glutamylamino)ethyl]phenoxymethyl)furan-2-yl)methanamine synthase
MAVTIGLDVGGAHLKVARLEDGAVTSVRQILCPLWQGLDKLDIALRDAAPDMSGAGRIAITMTGELSDLFPDRRTGVETLVRRLDAEFQSKATFWMGAKGFGSATDAARYPTDTGSTNFLATAALAATHYTEALLIDFGSTTADIIPIRNAKPAVRGLTDGERQSTGELVYTGFTRTPVMGVATRAPFQGHWVTLAREYLATMADVRRILGTLPDGADLHATADGKGKSLDESIARLARMLGRDGTDADAGTWRTTAAYVREEQLRSIEDGALQVLSAASLTSHAPLITAGIGASEATAIAHRLARPAMSFATLINCRPDIAAAAAASAPAVAVAILLSET